MQPSASIIGIGDPLLNATRDIAAKRMRRIGQIRGRTFLSPARSSGANPGISGNRFCGEDLRNLLILGVSR
jgi:hypothetical protein